MSSEALAIVNSNTGELMKPEGRAEVSPYEGASMQPVTSDRASILLSPLDPSEIEIKPDGSPYFPQSKYRRRLNQCFGPMGWALIPRGELSIKNSVMYRTYALFVGGRFVSEATGDQAYHENNSNMTYADAAEGAKSNALERCCKDLGIASELWDPAYIAAFKRDHCVQVWVTKNGQQKKQWRRKDRDPFENERQIDGAPQQTSTITNQGNHGPSSQVTSNPDVVSPQQAKSLYAIAMNSGFGPHYKKIITACGYKADTDVLKKHYQVIREFIEGTPVEQIDAGLPALKKWIEENK